jgi:hypothetical protein
MLKKDFGYADLPLVIGNRISLLIMSSHRQFNCNCNCNCNCKLEINYFTVYCFLLFYLFRSDGCGLPGRSAFHPLAPVLYRGAAAGGGRPARPPPRPTPHPPAHPPHAPAQGTSVADPNTDTHVFGPPGSGSISQRYGSGSGSGSFYR